jgi:esterase/lipase superfamily enzyme
VETLRISRATFPGKGKEFYNTVAVYLRQLLSISEGLRLEIFVAGRRAGEMLLIFWFGGQSCEQNIEFWGQAGGWKSRCNDAGSPDGWPAQGDLSPRPTGSTPATRTAGRRTPPLGHLRHRHDEDDRGDWRGSHRGNLFFGNYGTAQLTIAGAGTMNVGGGIDASVEPSQWNTSSDVPPILGPAATAHMSTFALARRATTGITSGGSVLASSTYSDNFRKTCRRVATVVMTTALLTACAGQPKGTLVPVSQSAPGTSRVEMLVATNRGRANVAGEMFSGERGSQLSFVDIAVSIPPESAHKVGEIEWPRRIPGNPATDFVTLKTDQISKTEALRQVNQAASMTPGRHVLVFIHGFDNRFEDAVYRFAQIIHDSNAKVAPVLFTWPSRGSFFAYGYDRESANYSRDALEGVLQALALDPKIEEISILAHSMGNWLALEALRQMSIRDGRIAAKIKNVMLAAPDVDVDVFRTQIADMDQPRPDVTLFVSRDDRALAVARRIWGDTVRLGAIDPQQEPYRSMLAEDAIAVVDLSQLREGDQLHHDKFAESPEVVRLIGRRLAGGQTLTDTGVGFGDRIVEATTAAATAAGTAAGMVIAAPVAVLDPQTRDNYRNQLDRLGNAVSDTATSARDLLIPTPAGLARQGRSVR